MAGPHPSSEDGLAQIWAYIHSRFHYEQAQKLKEHFEQHLADDGEAAAYQCFIRNLFSVMESLHVKSKLEPIPHQWLLKFAVEDNDDA